MLNPSLRDADKCHDWWWCPPQPSCGDRVNCNLCSRQVCGYIWVHNSRVGPFWVAGLETVCLTGRLFKNPVGTNCNQVPSFQPGITPEPVFDPCRIHPPIQSCVISDNTIRETPPALHEAIQEMIDRLKNVGCLAHWISNWTRRIY